MLRSTFSVFTKGFVLSLVLAILFGFGFAQKVALVATQKAGDNGPIDGLFDGLERAGEEFGLETRFIEALDPATQETLLRNLARTGADVIVSTFYQMGATAAIVAPDFPDTKFVVIVASPIEPPLENVRTLEYLFHEGAYVGGIYGAYMSESGQLGYTGGIALPFAWADFNAYTDGAKTVNEDIETTAVFIESFEDPVKGRELAAGVYAQGVDFIFTGAAASDIGVVEAATESDNIVMVASTPLIEQSPANVGIVVSIEWAETIFNEIEYALSDDFEGGYRSANIASGEIGFNVPTEFLEATTPDRQARAEAAQADMDAAIAGIKSGELVIEYIGEER